MCEGVWWCGLNTRWCCVVGLNGVIEECGSSVYMVRAWYGKGLGSCG